MVDPDWKPDMKTINKNDLELNIDAYQFKIWDRSGMSTRHANWLAKQQKNLTFAYYVHEDFRLPNGLPPLVVKQLDWEVHEVEANITWHTNVGHGIGAKATFTYERYLFDLDLLYQEQSDPDFKDSAHTLFYLGIVHAALLEGSTGYQSPFLNPDVKLSSKMQQHLELHILVSRQ